MSVIAKLYVSKFINFGTGSYVELSCVADNALMAAYAESDEDKLFSRYSPYGEIRLHQRQGWAVFGEWNQGHAELPGGREMFYAMMLDGGEAGEDPKFPGASAFIRLNCYSTTKFSQDGTRVELREVDRRKPDPAIPVGSLRDDRRDEVIEKLSWKMHVDNPPAEAQFVPGRDYWLAFYNTQKFDMQQAIAAAHGRA